jgi:hypothetical protein
MRSGKRIRDFVCKNLILKIARKRIRDFVCKNLILKIARKTNPGIRMSGICKPEF